MTQAVSRQACRATRHDAGRDDSSPGSWAKPTTNQASHQALGVVVAATPNSDGRGAAHPSQTGLTLAEIEAIIPHEYGPLTPWVERKLRFDYGVRDLPASGPKGRKLKIVAPIAEELVHDTIVELWEETTGKQVELKDKNHVRPWLKGALKITLRRWIQREARSRERHIYQPPGDNLYESTWLAETIDKLHGGAVWQTLEELYDDCHQRINGTLGVSSRRHIPADELHAALKHLPGDMQRLVNQVYRENMSWTEASASLNVDSEILEREVQQWFRTLRRHIPSYQPSQRAVRKDTRRVRKSFHCPVCEMPLKRRKGSHGAVCSGCRIGIHKALFAIKYSYRHA